jgi:hypothetical protein
MFSLGPYFKPLSIYRYMFPLLPVDEGPCVETTCKTAVLYNKNFRMLEKRQEDA